MQGKKKKNVVQFFINATREGEISTGGSKATGIKRTRRRKEGRKERKKGGSRDPERRERDGRARAAFQLLPPTSIQQTQPRRGPGEYVPTLTPAHPFAIDSPFNTHMYVLVHIHWHMAPNISFAFLSLTHLRKKKMGQTINGETYISRRSSLISFPSRI